MSVSSHEEGFTLIELMVALVIGMIILLGAFTSLDRFGVVSATVTTRTDATQRGRFAMDQIVRTLRSQVCTGPGGFSMLAGSDNSITVVTDLGDGTKVLEKRTFAYDAPTRRLRETRFKGNSLADPLPWSTTAGQGLSLTDVDPDAATGPIFGYWAYDTAVPPRPTVQLPVPLSATDLGRVTRITVAYRVGPAAGLTESAAGATLKDEVLLRSVDPADAVPVPLCA